MAKKKAAKAEWGSKSKIVKELIGQGKANHEIVTLMKEQGLSIHPTYVSAIRSKVPGAKRRRRRRKGKATSATAAPAVTATGNSGLRAAISFCKSVGGIKEAEKLIATLREIKNL